MIGYKKGFFQTLVARKINYWEKGCLALNKPGPGQAGCINGYVPHATWRLEAGPLFAQGVLLSSGRVRH